MHVKDPKTIIRNLYYKHVKIEENISYAEKLFIVNTVINYLFKDKTYKELDQFQIARYGELINKYLHDEVDIYWEDGIVMVRDLNSGEVFVGG